MVVKSVAVVPRRVHAAPGPPQVLLVNPRNTPVARARTVDLNIYPNLGLLTLGTCLQERLREASSHTRVLYFDGGLLDEQRLYDYIVQWARDIRVLGLSAYTYNYGACLRLAEHAKRANPHIITIIGNDHFSALYRDVMRRRTGTLDYGYYGNDVVHGFADFVVDTLQDRLRDLATYPGLVYRDRGGAVHRNPENPEEFAHLPLVDYSLMDSLVPHSAAYHAEQLASFEYMRVHGFKATTIDIARGCLKFAGPRTAEGVPLNACDFCAIVPGSKAVASPRADRAWKTIHNAVRQGYNYLFVTADELPATFWPLLRHMARHPPSWYQDLARASRPRMMAYARADSFRDGLDARIDLLMGTLGFDHFFVGFDGFTDISLRAMNKGITARATLAGDLLKHNLRACQEIARRGGRITAGAVLTHLGITPAILEANFQVMRDVLERHRGLFVEVDFELLGPLPGSLAFSYLRHPTLATRRAAQLGLDVDERYLEAISTRYQDDDLLDPDQLVRDFIEGCCPAITVGLAHEYLERTRDLLDRHGIVFECSSL